MGTSRTELQRLEEALAEAKDHRSNRACAGVQYRPVDPPAVVLQAPVPEAVAFEPEEEMPDPETRYGMVEELSPRLAALVASVSAELKDEEKERLLRSLSSVDGRACVRQQLRIWRAASAGSGGLLQ